jgi:hypothetical protein
VSDSGWRAQEPAVHERGPPGIGLLILSAGMAVVPALAVASVGPYLLTTLAPDWWGALTRVASHPRAALGLTTFGVATVFCFVLYAALGYTEGRVECDCPICEAKRQPPS